jgi:hypothetical protein
MSLCVEVLGRSRSGRRKVLSGLVSTALACGVLMAIADAQEQSSIDELLERVGRRVVEFYARAMTVVCTETSTVQPLDITNSPDGFARTVESELRMEMDSSEATGEIAVVRKILKVNGSAPRDKNSKDRSGCTDPGLRSPEALTFLLDGRRSEYEFRYAGTARDRNRAALMIDFATLNRRSKPELVEDPGGHEDCFDWTGHIASRGRIWVDAHTSDVLRIERTLRGPVDVSVPWLIQRRYRLANWVTIVRDDLTIRYKKVAFSDPDELLLVPESIHSFSVLRGGLQSTRRSQTFTDYKRFVTGGRVVQ